MLTLATCRRAKLKVHLITQISAQNKPTFLGPATAKHVHHSLHAFTEANVLYYLINESYGFKFNPCLFKLIFCSCSKPLIALCEKITIPDATATAFCTIACKNRLFISS